MIDARALRGWLGNKRAFAHWIKNRVEEYGFEEGADFMSLTTKTGGRPRTDYLLTVDMAKELSMVERMYRPPTHGGGLKAASLPFAPEGKDLRTIEIEGAPWFHATDVCRILGLKMGNSGVYRHTCRMPADEKRKVTRSSDVGAARELEDFFRDTPAPSATLVNESGLYRLIMRSDKATARPFQDWVTKVVMPINPHSRRRTISRRPVRVRAAPINPDPRIRNRFAPSLPG